jgi:hypothetical protein
MIAIDTNAIIHGVGVLAVDALTDLFKSTNGSNWTRNTNWLRGDPCADQWFGITCSSSNPSSVLSMYVPCTWCMRPEAWLIGAALRSALQSNNLQGFIPSSIANLPKLMSLYLYYNHLNGSVPNSISQLTSLMALYVQWR